MEDNRPMRGLIIYDFDGVIAESEVLVHRILSEQLTGLGMPTTVQDSYRLYMGKRFADAVALIEDRFGRSLPSSFATDFEARTYDGFRKDLRVVEGARSYIDMFAHVPRCIASSSPPARLALCLEVLGLQSEFGDHVFSATSIARGKPAPDIFLHAAQRMGSKPKECVVLEDSPSGVEAGLAAGMTVIGLLAGGHIQPEHAQRLRAAGAHHMANTYKEAEAITRRVLAGLEAS